MVLRLRGGAKKRKKKSYTTPKKNKHKRKKVKLAVLKYYKVRLVSSCRYQLVTVCRTSDVLEDTSVCVPTSRWLNLFRPDHFGSKQSLLNFLI